MRSHPLVLEPGQLVDRYQLLFPLASGGTSKVWAARLHGTRGFEKVVGLKTLAVPDSESRELERLLWREGWLASQIKHPNVVQCLDLIEHQGALCLAMEWVDGESLSSLLRAASRAGGLPLGVAVQIVVQACKGLHAAHELCGDDGKPLGLAHCDVSPPNLMIDISGTVKLVDFGIAKVRRVDADSDDRVRGKPSFMAPEQALGQRMDLRADIFSLGIVAYLLTTGRHPFRTANATDTLRAICSETPVVPPSAIVGSYPRGLQRVVLRALARPREQRFQSAAEMLSELVAAFPGYASEAELAGLLKNVCASSLASRRALLSEALERHSRASFLGTAGSRAPLLEPTSDTLSPTQLAASPAPVAATQARGRSVRTALVAGVVAFVAAFGWTLLQTDAKLDAHSASAAHAELAPESQPRALEVSRTVEQREPEVTEPSADSVLAAPADATPPPTPVAPAVSSSKAPAAPASKKSKPIPVRQRYGI